MTPARRYVALGDSYTASPQTGPLAGPPPGCDRSLNNYPHLLATRTGASLTDVSCGGATTEDLASAQAVRGGSHPAQFGALRRDTELVTVGVGGNDIGYAEIVRTCLSASPVGTPCRDRYTAGGTDQLRDRIAALGPELASTYTEVRRRAPRAEIFVVGYPSVLPAEGPGCHPTVPYTPGDVAYLRGVLIELNDEIRARAERAGVTYVDTAAPSVGHDACARPGARWIEGLLPAAPAIPLHPNALGQEALAQAVQAAL